MIDEIKKEVEEYIQEDYGKLSEFEQGANMALYRVLNILDSKGKEQGK